MLTVIAMIGKEGLVVRSGDDEGKEDVAAQRRKGEVEQIDPVKGCCDGKSGRWL